MNLIEILGIIYIHGFADFVMQDGKWAVGKSKNWHDLLSHTFMYSFIWLVIGAAISCPFFDGKYKLINVQDVVMFVFITFICHTITDYYTSRKTSKEYSKGNFGGKIPRGLDFFVVIELDQCLHYTQLFITYWLLTK